MLFNKMIKQVCFRIDILRFGDSDLDSTADNRGTETRGIKSKMIHPLWDYNIPLYYDIGIWETDRLVEFHNFIRPICLPEVPDPERDKYYNHFATLIGTVALNKFKDHNNSEFLKVHHYHYVLYCNVKIHKIEMLFFLTL